MCVGGGGGIRSNWSQWLKALIIHIAKMHHSVFISLALVTFKALNKCVLHIGPSCSEYIKPAA